MTRADAAQLHHGSTLDRLRGCAATPGLVSALGSETSTEEAEFVALSNAGVLALGLGPDSLRLVLAVEVPSDQVEVEQSADGEVTVTQVRWSQVQALFADETAAASTVAQARAVGAGGGLAEALVLPEVCALLEGFDLLWFATAELDELP